MEGAGKTRAIVAHITLIGWIIAYVQNNNDKSDFASFYIRQVLGLVIVGIGLSIIGNILLFIPFLGWLIYAVTFIVTIVLWIVSLMGAINGKKEPTPFIGHLFQIWFKSV